MTCNNCFYDCRSEPSARLSNFTANGLADICQETEDYEPKPEFTTEAITEVIATADTVNEIVAGAYCNPG
jgi:hypothetical protein